jgi:hypothetical protein
MSLLNAAMLPARCTDLPPSVRAGGREQLRRVADLPYRPVHGTADERISGCCGVAVSQEDELIADRG